MALVPHVEEGDPGPLDYIRCDCQNTLCLATLITKASKVEEAERQYQLVHAFSLSPFHDHLPCDSHASDARPSTEVQAGNFANKLALPTK